MAEDKFKNANTGIKRVTWVGVWVNVLLGLVKSGIGIMVNSVALTSDGLHSLSDLASDAAVLIGIKIGGKKPDEKHPYGHGRMETLAAFFISITLVVVGCYMIFYAGMEIARKTTNSPSVWAIIISIISVILKEVLYQITKKVAIKFDSSMLYANAWHHRSDALSSLAVVVGVGAAFMGFRFGDQIAGIIVGLMIITAGAKILGECFRDIAEERVDGITYDKIRDIIQSSDGVTHWHRLRTRTVGRELFIDVHILVDPELKITEAHDIAEGLENELNDEISRPVNIMVHIEPDIERLRLN